MKKFYTKTISSFIVFLIILSFLILNITNNKTDDKNKQYLVIYDFVVILFIVLLVLLVSYNGYNKGLIESLFIWAFFVVATPIPETGLLVTLPLKRFFNLSMPIVQTITSIFALGICFFYYKYEKSIIILDRVGGLFDKLYKSNSILIFVLSIASSIYATNLLENIIDNYVDDKKIINLNNKLITLGLFIFLYFRYLYIQIH
jgi:hypothetical protein